MKLLTRELLALKNSDVAEKELVDIVSSHATTEQIVEYLAEQTLKPIIDAQGYSHQLGFHKFIISDLDGTHPRKIRLHLWEKGKIEDDIHDHIAPFASKILHGYLTHEIYQRGRSGEHFFWHRFSACSDGCVPSEECTVSTELELACRTTIAERETYFLNYDALHRAVPVSQRVISLVVQDTPVDRQINVFRCKPRSTQSDLARRLSNDETRAYFQKILSVLGNEE
ncbi:hypothetical protein ACNRBH_00735 [Ralstonia pseudosolanacearum]|uniref:hypothetical protein n=1 Tax=Ralstonia pseudosolanacearum TaxID=1310165 RepID=UPI003AAA7393